METTITATELARELSEILNRVKYKGETFTVVRNGVPIATIGPVVPKKGITLGELVELWDKLPKPDEDFWTDLEEIHNSQTIMEPPRWG